MLPCLFVSQEDGRVIGREDSSAPRSPRSKHAQSRHLIAVPSALSPWLSSRPSICRTCASSALAASLAVLRSFLPDGLLLILLFALPCVPVRSGLVLPSL